MAWLTTVNPKCIVNSDKLEKIAAVTQNGKHFVTGDAPDGGKYKLFAGTEAECLDVLGGLADRLDVEQYALDELRVLSAAVQRLTEFVALINENMVVLKGDKSSDTLEGLNCITQAISENTSMLEAIKDTVLVQMGYVTYDQLSARDRDILECEVKEGYDPEGSELIDVIDEHVDMVARFNADYRDVPY